jgi:hypothetical protein
MGIGYPLDIVVCSALGADMCVESVPGQAGRVPVMDVAGIFLAPRTVDLGINIVSVIIKQRADIFFITRATAVSSASVRAPLSHLFLLIRHMRPDPKDPYLCSF